MRKMIKLCGFAMSGLLVTIPALAGFVLVEDGESRAPIVIFADAPPLTRQAADELAYYIEKTSGAKPEVLDVRPDPLPDSAIWVGVQPAVRAFFPDLDFDFQHPQEILIAANDNHLVIAGRDVWDPDHLTVSFRRRTVDGVQQEYGTHNAVYTFLHDHLGVRWLWPGELGEDVLKQDTIALAPFVYRYHPQVLARHGLFPWTHIGWGGVLGPDDAGWFEGGARSQYWARAQRLQLSSNMYPSECHGPWGGWWKRFHKTNPEFFALQPDGSRGGGEQPFPSENTIKMCFSNPDLWQQWLADVEEQIKENPNLKLFNVSPTDSFFSGHCICEGCRAWDHPDGEPRMFHWQGIAQQYVALSDRDITFANTLARLLKERFPDRDLYVYMLAYGHSCPPPVEAVPDDNVIVGNVANFLFRSDYIGRYETRGIGHRNYLASWGKLTDRQFWRPNVGNPVGWRWGMPDVPLRRTMADMRFVAENGWMGFHVDFLCEHWSTQGPLYYLMAHLTWDPYADGEAILADYYERAFGPAAEEMEAYWNTMEAIREECYGTERPGVSDHDPIDFYNDERLDKPAALLAAAKNRLGTGEDRYLDRIGFVEVGFRFTRLYTEAGRLMRRIESHGDPDGEIRAQAMGNWKQIWALRQAHPGALRWNNIFRGPRGDGPPARHDPGFVPGGE